MSETAQTRDEKGRFVAGNPLWQLHAFAEGNKGRPNKWTPEECAEIISDYLQDKLNENQPITRTGIINALGISWEALSNYCSGEYGKTDTDRRAYVEIFRTTNSLIEEQLESALMRDKGQVSGVIFRLTNQFGDRWRSEKHISIENNEIRTIKLVLPEDSTLRKRLAESDGGEMIEGEVVKD